MQTKEPIIWKKESCLAGQCKDLWTNHWWSIPFTAAFGLVSECFNCKKLKRINVEK